MRLGVMIGAERGDSARKVSRLLADIEWAEGAGMDTAWIPQVPNDFDALLAVALMGTRTTRIELGTAVVPLQAQHPVALARQALSTHAATGGRLALGVGPSHHWIIQDMLGLPYQKPAAYTRDYLEVLHAAFAGPGQIDVENDHFTVHNPNDLAPVAPLPVLIAALGPVMLALAGEHADGTVLWMAPARAIETHVAPKLHAAAAAAGRPAPRIVAGLPVAVHDDIAEARAAASASSSMYAQMENYTRILEIGGAGTPADAAIVGNESSVTSQLQSLLDAGATDIWAAVFPVGDDRRASMRRSKDLLRELVR